MATKTKKPAEQYRVVCSEYESDPFTSLERVRKVAGQTEQSGMCHATHHVIERWTGTGWEVVESTASAEVRVEQRPATEPGALDGWWVVCAWCGDTGSSSIEMEAYRLGDQHVSWHLKQPRPR